MGPIRVNSANVYEPELDMNRRGGQASNGMMRRLIVSLLGYPRTMYTIGKPRRSIDREEQEYSPSYE